MRSYLLCSLLIVSVAAVGCGDSQPSTDARDGAGDGMGDGSVSNDRADVGGDKPANGGNGGTSDRQRRHGRRAREPAGGSAGSAGTGGASGNDGGAGAAPTAAAPTARRRPARRHQEQRRDRHRLRRPLRQVRARQHLSRERRLPVRLSRQQDLRRVQRRRGLPGHRIRMRAPDLHGRRLRQHARGRRHGAARSRSTGDCKRRQCATDGTVTTVNDDTDVPDDRNPCTNDICTTGAPSHTMMPANSNCGGANHCNATGQCVGCTVAADCPGTDTACRTRTCTAGGVCGFSSPPSGTKLVDPTRGRLQGPAVRRRRQRAGLQRQRRPARSTATSARPTSAARARRPTARSRRGRPAAAAWSATAPPTASSACRRAPAPAPTPSATRAAASSGACGVSQHRRWARWSPAQTPRDCKKNVVQRPGRHRRPSTTTSTCPSTATPARRTSARPARRRNPPSPRATAAAPTPSATVRAPASPA